jgi:diadenylate cyclase
MNWVSRFLTMNWTDAIEIAVLAVLFYAIILFFRGTRSAQVLTGFILFLVAMAALTRFLHLNALNWLLQRISVYVAIAFVVIFQPEIRRALAELGKQSVFTSRATSRNLVDQIVHAVSLLSERKIGALIAVERNIGTRAVQDTGTRLDSTVSAELLASIFYPHTPLHDGGVIISGNRIRAAACLFPLSQQSELSKSLGTRHRAAIGLSEETDAVVVVVSEETGSVSIAYKGRLVRGLEEDRLRRILSSILNREQKLEHRLSRFRQELDAVPQHFTQTETLKEFES